MPREEQLPLSSYDLHPRSFYSFGQKSGNERENARLDVVAIGELEPFPDHLITPGDNNEIQEGNFHESPADHLSAFLLPGTAFQRVHYFPPHLLEDDSLALSSRLDISISNRDFIGINDIDGLDDYSDFRSSLSESSLPSHVEMVRSYQKFMQDMGTGLEKSKITRLIRNVLSVRGLKMLDIRYKLHHWYKDWVSAHGSVSVETQKSFAFLLIESEWYEDKVAAVLFIQEVLIAKKNISHMDFPRFEAIFRGRHIKVYKVCDYFASKILCHLAEHSRQELGQRAWILNCLFEWTYAVDLWQARAAMLALATQTNKGVCQNRLMCSVRHMLTRPEEEAKSIAGAALRSISEVDPGIVIQFLSRSENMVNISVYALDKATSRLTKIQRDSFKNTRRRLRS